jgi:hypothetical protein
VFDAGDTVNHLLKQNDFVEIVEAEIVDQTFEPFLGTCLICVPSCTRLWSRLAMAASNA